MAEAALFGIAKSVLEQLGSPALDEFRLLWGHKANLERLENTVTTITNVLQDADRRQATDAAVKGWIARLRVALYEADDLFDLISAKVLQEKDKTGTKIGKQVRRIVSKPYRFAKTAHKVKDIRESLDDIARDMNQFSFLPAQAEQDQPFTARREQTHSYVPKDEVVGRDQEREEIVRMMLPQERKGVSVIAVIGIGGLGKTTLAQLVYNDDRVQQAFDLCMWACINYFSYPKQVLVALLKSATKGEPQDLDLDQLQSLFRKEIEGKRFLLVLDDVWDEDPQKWYKLKLLLDSGKDGSMVLATTRSELVARSLCAAKPYFNLQGISDESAWFLFKKIALGEEEDQQSLYLEQLGQQIVKKCANVPLAIVTIASLLRDKDKKKWFPLVNDELSRAAPDEYKKIMHALEISYKELPYPVKRCFGYCSLFPKDYKFEKDLLVRLWIAQGFVEPCVANQSMEDRAEDYFFCLVERCFFQHAAINEQAEDVTCQMHDLMHDLAKEVAGSESILVDQTAHGSWDKTTRHLSIDCQSESIVDHVCSFSHSKSLRTFLPIREISLEKSALNKLISGLRSVRVLDLSDLEIEKVPTSVGELIHLRFLNLSRNKMKRLPSSICSLPHLQSLLLQGCYYLEELPEELGNLQSLRHLVLKGCHKLSQMPPGLAALTSLVTLDRLVVHKSRGGLEYLERLDSLSRSLEIELRVTGWKNATTDAERSLLSRKSRLHRLAITCESKLEDTNSAEPDTADQTWMNALQPHPNLEDLSIQKFGGKEIPHWVKGLHNLVSLKLERCSRCVELPPMSHLQFLKELHISHMSPMLTLVDNKVYEPNLFFPSLETLSIGDMPNLTSWWLQPPIVLPAFPRATKVEIGNCPKLTRCMPLFPLVEDLRLEGVQEELLWQVIGSEETSLTSQGQHSVLKTLRIRGVEDLSSIAEAQIRHLSALQKLKIKECQQLEAVSCNGLAHLTSLERLKISSCSKLNKWVNCGGEKPDFPWGHLPRLRHLEIPNLNKKLFKGLIYMCSLERLVIDNSFNEELASGGEEEEEGMPWKHLQKLQYMDLVFGETFSMRSRPRLLHGFQHLTSLQYLTLSECKELYLPWRALLGLKHLWFLEISNVEKVIDVDSDATSSIHELQLVSSSMRQLLISGGSGEWVDDIPWKSFPFLTKLWLFNIRKLEGLPEGIQHLAALRYLILGLQCVVSLPDWMTSLSSLNYLSMWDCSEELKKRCERLKGEDWPKIEHIKTIDIR